MWRKRVITFVWGILSLACVWLLIAAMQKKEHKICSDVKVTISAVNDQPFVKEEDVMQVLQNSGAVKNAELAAINLRKAEEELKKNPWVSVAELFFDNNQVLHAKIEEREPVARIFTMQGNTFYIDSNLIHLPVCIGINAAVPVFTSFPSDKKILSAPDSMVLKEIKKIAQYIQRDSFWMAQVAQVDVTSHSSFELIPVMGNQVIELGDADNLDEKFSKLLAFYRQVWSKTGFEKYEKIDVQYKDQVVATRKGAAKYAADTTYKSADFVNNATALNVVKKDSTGNLPKQKPVAVKTVNTKKANTKKTGGKKQMLPALKSPGKKVQQQPKAVMKKPAGKN